MYSANSNDGNMFNYQTYAKSNIIQKSRVSESNIETAAARNGKQNDYNDFETHTCLADIPRVEQLGDEAVDIHIAIYKLRQSRIAQLFTGTVRIGQSTHFTISRLIQIAVFFDQNLLVCLIR